MLNVKLIQHVKNMFFCDYCCKQMIDHHRRTSDLLMLPLGLLRLLKPCKVKRFLATEDLSMGGLVTGSSGNHSVKWKCQWERGVVTKMNESQRRRETEG